MKVKELIAYLQGLDDIGEPFNQEDDILFSDGCDDMTVLSIYSSGGVVYVDIGN